jgi:hypothetical protein
MEDELKGYERKRLWPNLKYYHSTYVEDLRKPTKMSVAITGLRGET